MNLEKVIKMQLKNVYRREVGTLLSTFSFWKIIIISAIFSGSSSEVTLQLGENTLSFTIELYIVALCVYAAYNVYVYQRDFKKYYKFVNSVGIFHEDVFPCIKAHYPLCRLVTDDNGTIDIYYKDTIITHYMINKDLSGQLKILQSYIIEF